MAYLTSSEFQQFGYSPPFNEDDFDSAEQSAEIAINSVTSFYDPNLGSQDLVVDVSSSFPYRVKRATAFKKAVAMQTQFVIDSNAKSAYELQQNNVSSYSVGGTSMTFKSGVADTMTVGSTGVLKAVRTLLGQYGLLYVGVDHV
ncbi:hypothetical protein [Liquorilactobacillus mali]|uniref:Uncharacterized protein n=1 Tax=Liquorilactobacillus mali KCTC 3596 = DSM 20444 TaxID=1046596 RepID=J0KWR7_9LACO|nr:hypothetical protein [Liquorilactobacillus mali]EJE97700.1 hypothetical protein LMA_09380 [Liquorilactobacillus mali KCTC 3596 = DSM 20444]KRN08806.1 hypothetical protein FD00_GL001757 [Liquorilactobacillus mali KCTC 3596 = DSM 20444]QFQ75149.1 hypothetical protein LM596_08540 [Liquorilactobacillus mali]